MTSTSTIKEWRSSKTKKPDKANNRVRKMIVSAASKQSSAKDMASKSRGQVHI